MAEKEHGFAYTFLRDLFDVQSAFVFLIAAVVVTLVFFNDGES
jgi:hypothetical protein